MGFSSGLLMFSSVEYMIIIFNGLNSTYSDSMKRLHTVLVVQLFIAMDVSLNSSQSPSGLLLLRVLELNVQNAKSRKWQSVYTALRN